LANSNNNQKNNNERRLFGFLHHRADAKEEDDLSATPNSDDGTDGAVATPNPNYEYAVLVISYHKTGHDLQQDLVTYLQTHFPNTGPGLTEHGNKSSVKRRRHPPKTPCARVHTLPGTISVQHAPDLFCTPEELAHMVMEGGAGRRSAAAAAATAAADHVGQNSTDRGVKIVHLVRNPFEMAVSNYLYHARVPTPEGWILHQNPCQTDYTEEHVHESYASMVLPILSKTKYINLDLDYGDDTQLFSQNEFDDIEKDCLSLYKTRERLKQSNFLSHLINYDPPEGIRLSTAQMMIQGYNYGGDILRMAHNIIKWKETSNRVRFGEEYVAARKELQVYTMSLDDFISDPAGSALRFFDFVFEGATAAEVTHEEKWEVAQMYAEYYRQKMVESGRSGHVTHNNNKRGDPTALKEYLRHDPVYGPPLSKIEKLVEVSLLDTTIGRDKNDGM